MSLWWNTATKIVTQEQKATPCAVLVYQGHNHGSKDGGTSVPKALSLIAKAVVELSRKK